ncbi:rubrerythrin family protein [Alkalibaculum sp. M08DMB]|uniref:Rubrerythrin family protein n=1 Tax=Alkalibaculum sporogenes TaxID=2655001 RepID=A0A6A7K7L9_9FIRM|nr:rubrerythrin family protein [Alkalibaculum sporogenes]MPW25385.1 rubrerythrin family protein [Alkalibaculum sporogenes]
MENRLKGSKTAENLMKAFAGESQARNRYTFYAEKAQQEKQIQISNVFNETAHNEKYHAERFFRFLNTEFKGEQVAITDVGFPVDLGTTLENLEAAARGEHEEHAILYPAWAKEAEEEGFSQIATVFELVSKVEKKHEERFNQYAQRVLNNEIFRQTGKVKWVCLECGHVHEGIEAPDACPICSRPKGFFKLQL